MRWLKRREEDSEETSRLVRHAAELHGVRTSEVVHAVLDEDDDELDEEEPRRSRKGLWITLVIVGVVFGLGIVGLMKLSSMADSSGPTAISGIAQINASIAPTAQVNPTLSGTHIVFTYPAVFDTVNHPDNWGSTMERYELVSKSDYRKSIQIYVEDTPTLQYDSGYVFRAQHGSDYIPNPVKVMGEPAVVMVKNDQSERTLYWAHAGHVVIMSATGEGNVLAGYMSVLTSSLRWVH